MRTHSLACGLAILLLGTLETAAASDTSGITFEQRVALQRRIEDVYWRHRAWPRENPAPKPASSSLLSDAVLHGKVEDSLRKSNALATVWGQPITTRQLQAELNRMARQTRSPETLRELFAVLGNDPAVIAETLARQTLADRLIRERYANEPPQEAETDAPARTPLEAWWAGRRGSVGVEAAPVAGPYSLPAIAVGGCVDDTWEPTRFEAPDGRDDHTAVWTGSEMIVWGGRSDSGGRYDPATDSWTHASRVNAPSARSRHTAVWTGTEMIVWGGDTLNSGGRYDPATDTWTPTSLTSAPAGRFDHTAVWTGTEMIVWGGEGFSGSFPVAGGRYKPGTDTWTATSTVNAPGGGARPTAVWTGTVMIVWGGYDGVHRWNTGGRYDPSSDSWTATSTVSAPAGRFFHSAVWTGHVMIVWGGLAASYDQTGGRYDPSSDSWTATTTAAAPSARSWHTAVWTGTEMIVWGGTNGSTSFNTGGRYNPDTNTWLPISLAASAPSARKDHRAVWTGTEMIVWGGDGLRTGGRYDPSTDTWTPTTTGAFVPAARAGHSVVWTGAEMIVWGAGSNTGGRYDPATDTWTPTSTAANVPSARAGNSAVWTGTEMIVWGGNVAGSWVNSGGRYNPSSDTWTPTSIGANVPGARTAHTAVWTGTRMIVWGGKAGAAYLSTGGGYDPSTDSWVATTLTGAPSPRQHHTAVWTGSRMIVWGGEFDDDFNSYVLETGGRYDPSSNTWTPTSMIGVPAARAAHTAVWTGNEMIVWGGRDATTAGSTSFATGGRYDPVLDTWTAVSTGAGVPSARHDHVAVWTGTAMIVWGGGHSPFPNTIFDTGARYDAAHDVWQATSTAAALPVGGRYAGSAVWTGEQMIVWGGNTALVSASGGSYCALPCASPGAVGALSASKAGATMVLSWAAVPDATAYDVLRGSIAGLPVGSSPGTETCVAQVTGTTASDADVPGPGQGSWQLVRARNGCGLGSWGQDGSGGERISASCP